MMAKGRMAWVAACALLVVAQASLPVPQASNCPPPATSGLALLYALPYRRLEYEKRQTVAAETAFPDIARADIAGFTLIEMAIVLMIIGLIVGGVLYGQELISKAAARAQISQIEKFNAAANTFFGKYAYLPGDIPAGPAAQFGFQARGTVPGEGDGNGLIENPKSCGPYSSVGPAVQASGEQTTFWVDLTTAHLIEGGFNTANETGDGTYYCSACGNLGLLFPQAKLGSGSYVYVWSGGQANSCSTKDGNNYFGIEAISVVNGFGFSGYPSMTVAQAYAIDAKTDDGFPQTGRVLATFNNSGMGYAPWSAGNAGIGASPGTVASPSSTTCFDNGGNSSNPMAYSVTQNNGSGVNCALSFRMQAGD